MTATIKKNLPLFDGMVNPSVLPEDELRLSYQCRLIFNRLKNGPATNVQLQRLTNDMNTAGRISDTRIELKKHGWTVEIIKTKKILAPGVNLYAMIDGDGIIVK